MSYHRPVLLKESIAGLNIDPRGVYVDATFGGGGHAREILNFLIDGKLFGFDQDKDAFEQAKHLTSHLFTFIPVNFRFMKKYLRLNGVNKLDGVLADLGISSHQIDVAERGFSTRFEAVLDMRMDRHTDLTARDVINTYDETSLQKILSDYGEVRNAKSVAAALVAARSRGPLNTVTQLIQSIEHLVPKKRRSKYLAQVFQALRIEVNDELGALNDLLDQCEDLIRVGGRLVVISYHSLEDRAVKNFMNTGNPQGHQQKDFFGNLQRPFRPVVRKPVAASPQEISQNPRARSAKLRIAERI